MKKVIFFISCFFFMLNSTWAINLDCPEIASPGEEIWCHISDDTYSAVKAKYQFDTGLNYQNIKVNGPFKSYYDGVNGFSIGNVTDNSKLALDFSIKISMDVDVNREYSVSLVEVEGSTLDGKYVQLDDLSSKVMIKADINTLDSLSISNGNLSPKFDKNTLSYEAVVNDDNTIIKATLTDTSAKIEGDIGEKKLNYGVNAFSVKVTSARGTERVYKIYITRPLNVSSEDVEKNNDATLKSLELSSGKINFKKDKFLYKVDVDYEVEEIEVKAVSNDTKAKVEIQKTDRLIVGENIVKVIVTAEDGTVATYVIVVNRKDKLSSDATIKSLEIKNYEIYFKSDIYEYELEIDNEDKLDIRVILNDDRAKYKIKGNKNLKNNSVIEVKVTAEDGSSSIYKITINKLNENNSKAISDYIKFVPLVVVVMLIVSVLFIKVLKIKFVKK